MYILFDTRKEIQTTFNQTKQGVPTISMSNITPTIELLQNPFGEPVYVEPKDPAYDGVWINFFQSLRKSTLESSILENKYAGIVIRAGRELEWRGTIYPYYLIVGDSAQSSVDDGNIVLISKEMSSRSRVARRKGELLEAATVDAIEIGAFITIETTLNLKKTGEDAIESIIIIIEN